MKLDGSSLIWKKMSDRTDDPEYNEWAKRIKHRDHYTCQICGVMGTQLESHHLFAWASHPDVRLCDQNGTCLCKRCHHLFHALYGKGENTPFQFNNFKKVAIIFKKMLGDGYQDQD